MGPTRNGQPVYVNEQDLLFSDLFFYSKKKKVGVELETKATKNNVDSNLGFQHNCWVEYRPSCTQLFVENSLILMLLLNFLHIMACTHMNTDLLNVHTCFSFYPMDRCVCCVCISGLHDPSLKTNGRGTGGQRSRR